MDYKYNPEWKVLLIPHFFIELLQLFNCTNNKPIKFYLYFRTKKPKEANQESSLLLF